LATSRKLEDFPVLTWTHDEQGYPETIPGTRPISTARICLQDYTYRQAVTAVGTGCMAVLDVNAI
jgi:thioredoxin reductase (NADPH)